MDTSGRSSRRRSQASGSPTPKRSRCSSRATSSPSVGPRTRSATARRTPTASPSSSTATSTTRTSATPTATSAPSTAAPATRARATCCRSRSSSRRSRRRIALGGTGLLMQGGHHPDLGDRLLRGSVPLDQGALQDPPARAVAAGDPAHRAAQQADALADDLPAPRRRPRLDSRRRRRDPRRPRPPRDRAEEDEDEGVARRHAPRTPARHVDDGDDDVRPRRDGRRARRAHAPHSRPAGRDRRLPRLHLVDVPERRQPPRRQGRAGGHADVVRLPAHAGGLEASTSTTSRTSSRPG